MIPTTPLHSGMPTGKKYMGWWGAMGGPTQRGITAYSLASTEQKPMAGAFRQYLFFGFKRIMGHLPYAAPPVIAGYALYSWSIERNHYLNSKAGHREFAEHEE